MVGFDARNKGSLLPIFICRFCSLLLRDPVQLACGHRQCHTCVDAQDGSVIKCAECQEETSRSDVMVDRGFKNDMQELDLECSVCNWIGKLKNYQAHFDKTHPNPKCNFCGKLFDSPAALDRHKAMECTLNTTHCLLKDFGCDELIARCNLPQHYLTEKHQVSLIKIVKNLFEKQRNVSSDGQTRATRMELDVPVPMATNNTSSIPLQEVYETINILSGGIQTLNDDAQRLSSESLRYQSSLQVIVQEVATLKLSVEEKNAFLDGLRPNQEILQQDIASLKQKVEDLQFISYDGTLTWKIISFQEKMADAQSERQTSIYSPPFYSSPTGYKMRARLYLHGDGNARRTHMSLFFVLMRGEFDAILKFPFNFKVTFCLYDQTPQQRHIIDSFRPDTKSNSFQRPRSEMNIASGIPKFFPLPMIQQDDNPYVRDDTMFIKVMVDFGDMPKTLLPYALSLNPGLPTHVQQAMIRQEADRRSQQTPQLQQQQQTPSSPTANTATNRPMTMNLPLQSGILPISSPISPSGTPISSLRSSNLANDDANNNMAD